MALVFIQIWLYQRLLGDKLSIVNVPYIFYNSLNKYTLRTTRIDDNLESYHTISSVFEKVFKSTLRKRFITQDLRPLLESTNSLSSFPSSRDDERFSDCFIWSEENIKPTKRTCKGKTCHNFNSNKVAPEKVAQDRNYNNLCQNVNKIPIQSQKKKNSRLVDERAKKEENVYHDNINKNITYVQTTMPKNDIPRTKIPQLNQYSTIPYPNYQHKSNIKQKHLNRQMKYESNIKLGYFLNLIDRTTAPNRRKKTASMCPFISFKRSREKYLEDETITKEHRKQLKKKLIDIQKRPDTYVILALF